MRRIRTLVLAFSSLVSVPALASSPDPKGEIARGKYLVETMGCHHCHTPTKMGPKGPERDMARLLSGHPADLKMPPAPDLGNGPWMMAASASFTAFAGPWGVSFAANLTPDRETGIGSWTEKMFLDALKTGRHQGKGRPILPPMPTDSVAIATEKDLRAILSYLRSLPPVKNAVPQPIEPAAPPAPPR